MMEKILIPAIWVKDDKEYFAQPENIQKGFVITGYRHNYCYNTLIQIKLFLGNKKVIENVDLETGFLSNKNKFYNRIESAKIAYKAKQINKKVEGLISEDLY